MAVNAESGSGIWFGQGDGRNKSIRLPESFNTNNMAEIYAALEAVRLSPKDTRLGQTPSMLPKTLQRT